MPPAILSATSYWSIPRRRAINMIPTVAGTYRRRLRHHLARLADTLGDNSGTSIKAQIFDAAGDPVGDEFLVNTADANNQLIGGCHGPDGGGFVITWDDTSGRATAAAAASRRRSSMPTAAAVGSEFLVNTQTANDQYIPTITALAGGGFVITWHDRAAHLATGAH